MRVATLCVTSLLFLCAAADGAPQQVIINGAASDMQLPGLPGMGRQFKTGTARIRGRITTDTGSPVRRAQVRILGQEIASKTAMTDSEGRYEFRDLPPGRFTLSATKSGYVTVQYGQTRPFESGKPIEMIDAQVLDKADISMPRGSVIAGRILDEFGEPVPDTDVVAMRSVWSNGKRRLQPSGGRNSQTNDLGQFRLYGLPPGEYYVSATLRGGGDFMMMDAMITATAAGPGPAPSGSTPRSGYAPTYFPGTTIGADAQKITLTAGQETQGTDFALLPVKLAKITGTVIGSDGKPVDGSMINAVPRNGAESGMMFPMGQNSGRTDKNGNFTMNNVAPGDYTLQTRAIQIMTSGEGGTMMFSARIGGPGAGGADAESGSVPVSINGEDLTNVIIVTSKGATAAGRIVFEGGTKPATAGSIRVTAVPTDNDGPMLGGGMATVQPDGSFEAKGLSGTRLFRAVGLPQGWILKAVEHNGIDITDSGMEFRPGEAVTGIDIIATSKLTQVSGAVKAANGDAVKDYTVVIFSDEAQKWTAPMTRYVTGVRPDQEGHYQVKNLPAGGYYAVAVEYMAQGEWGDPDTLTRLRDKATKFSLDEGETKTLDLKLSGQ